MFTKPNWVEIFHFSYLGDFSIPEVEEVEEVEEVDVPGVPDAEEEQGKSYTQYNYQSCFPKDTIYALTVMAFCTYETLANDVIPRRKWEINTQAKG